MDWITTLRAHQADFIERLKSGYLLYCDKEGQHSELTVISGDRLERLRHFCWQMAEKYKKTSSVRDVFINNLKRKLGEEVVKDRLGKLVTEIDYEKKLRGDGKVDFTLNYNPSVGIQVKARHRSIDTVKWWISKEEIDKNTILVCILIQESVNEAQPKYNLVSAGFLPIGMIDITNGTASLGIDALLYISGLHSYISSLNYPKEQVVLATNKIAKNKSEDEQNEYKKDFNIKYIEHQTIILVIDYFLLGNLCLEQDDYQGALVNYNQVLQLNPNIADAYLVRACTRCKLGDIQSAKEDFEQAILINPVDAQLYLNRGSFHYDTGNINDAIEDYNQSIKIMIINFYALFMRGKIYAEIGNKKADIEDYTQSLKINIKSAEAYFNRGLLYYQTRETQKAIEDFSQAISIDNNKIEAYLLRGIARYDRRIDKGAIIDFTQVIKLDPNQASAYVRRGIVFDEIREYEKAIEDFDSALIINPNFAEAYEN
ncbi:tetratricopeptide repeat protein [Nostoc sp.]|uniref:tetratricopeptide repeat protein n=1 Tax=Nostoc sp. TaxID=1180 RepID=UPI002FFA20FF